MQRLTAENQAAVKEFVSHQGRSKTLRMSSNDGSDYGDFDIVKLIWSVVDGGVTTAVFPLAEVHKIDPEYKKDELAIETAIFRVLRSCTFAGVGVDFQEGDSDCQLRLALLPSAEFSAEEVEQQVEAAILAVVESSPVSKEQTEAEDSQATEQGPFDWRAATKTWRVSILEADEPLGKVVLIEGATADLSLLLPLM